MILYTPETRRVLSKSYGARPLKIGFEPQLDISCLHDFHWTLWANGMDKWLVCDGCGKAVDRMTVDHRYCSPATSNKEKGDKE
jgi:hypothetical protein